MKNKIALTTLREIKSTLGRFIAIMAIIALGVGFYAGLMVTDPAMRESMNIYLKGNQFFDYRMISTLGFEDEDIEKIAAAEGVRAAEGSKTQDMLVMVEDRERTVKVMSITKDVNKAVLIEGRLPEADNECVIDSMIYGDWAIGKTLNFTEENSGDDLENFKHSALEIVGIVKSPLYIQYERGTTSLGNGSLDGFIFVDKSAFDTDYYTECYVKLDKDPDLYSDEYKELLEANDAVFEELLDNTALERYDRIVADANEELADAKEEFETEKADAEKELSDAKKELDDGKAELDDAKKQLSDAEIELADAKKEIDDGEKTLADSKIELDDAKVQLDEAKADIEEGEKTLKCSKKQLDDAKAQLDDAKAEIDEGEKTLAESKKQLEDAKAQLDEYGEQLEAADKQLADSKKQLEEGWAVLEASKKQLAAGQAELDKSKAEIDEGEIVLEKTKAELDAGKQVLDKTKAELEAGKAQLEMAKALLPAAEYEKKLAEIEAGYAQYEMALAQYEAGKKQYEAGVLELSKGKAAYEAGAAQLEEGTKQYEAGLAEYNAGKEQYEKGLAEYTLGKAEYEKGVLEYEAGKEQYEAGLADFNAGKAEYEKGLLEYNNGKAEYEKGLADFNEGKKEYEDGLAKYEDGLVKYEEGKAELEDGKAEYEKGLKEYEDGLAEYEEGLQEYEDGLAEYNDGKAEFDEKIADAEQEIKDAEKEIADLKKPDTYLLDRNTNVGYACFESDSTIVGAIAKVFPIFFFLVAALVCMTTMGRMVEDQRTQIGILKALGYSGSAIMSKFVVYSGSAAIVGAIIGFIAGTIGFPNAIWFAYGMMYDTRNLDYYFSPFYLTVSIIVALACSVGVTIITCRVAMNEMAASLMRPKAPKAGKRILLEHIPFFWNKLKFLQKVSLRNIFRYKGRLIMMILGIGGCTALLTTGLGIYDSIADIAESQYTKISIYDAEIKLKDPVKGKVEALDELGYTKEDYLMFYETTVDVKAEDGEKNMYLRVFNSDDDITPFYNLHDKKGNKLELPSRNTAILNRGIAERLNVKVGDTVTISSDNIKEFEVNVVALNENFISNYIYITSETYESNVGSIEGCKDVLLNVKEGQEVHAAAAEISSKEGITSISICVDMRSRIANMMKSLNIIVYLVIGCAAALAFVVVYNLTNINITERVREIATIKVLGFYRNETADYVFRENLIMSLMGGGVGLLLGKALHSFVMSKIVVDLITFDIHVAPLSYVISFILTVLFTVVVNLFMNKKLEAISMTESLKAVE